MATHPNRRGRGRTIDETGNRYGKLLVIGVAEGRTRKTAVCWVCRCDCGTERVVPGITLRVGAVRSCGCNKRKHGMTQTSLYKRWRGMVVRCSKPGTPSYDNYGGRGIRVCDRWMSFENFFADMGEPPPGTSLDRIDPNGNYEPGNCRWADHATQQWNIRNRIPRLASVIDAAIGTLESSRTPSYSRAETVSIVRNLRAALIGDV